MEENTNKKQKWSIIFLILSFFFLILSTPFISAGYFVGRLLATIIPWSILLGIISYLIWYFGFHKRKGLLLFIFSILFLLAATFQLATEVFKGYVAQKYLDNLEKIDIDSPEVFNRDEQQNIYLNEENNFSIVFPNGWEVKKGGVGAIVKAVKKESIDEIAMISITIENFDEPVEDITKKSREIKMLYEKMGMSVEDFGETIINENKSIWVKGKQDFPLIGKVESLIHVFIENNKLYFISALVNIEHSRKYENAFRKSISTFRLLSSQ